MSTEGSTRGDRGRPGRQPGDRRDHLLTNDGLWDAIGTLATGALLVCVAAILAVETKSLLIEEGASDEDTLAIEKALVVPPSVERITHMRTLYLGPEELLVAAKVAVPADASGEEITRTIDEAEQRVRAAIPDARVIYIEPDLYRPERGGGARALVAEGRDR